MDVLLLELWLAGVGGALVGAMVMMFIYGGFHRICAVLKHNHRRRRRIAHLIKMGDTVTDAEYRPLP
jgi:hypothetical protein